ncbi:MAG: alpha/beta hydrolase [Gammaproteobacteria bacterium]|nr:alpha/beta hydrolase [Gammaproteobacteria bacterium]
MPHQAFTHHFANLTDLKMHYVTCGEGPALVLLHGFPQTWYEWRHIMPALSEHYRVIAPDLRGLGDSTRPFAGYDKRTVAGDIWQLVHGHLGYQQFFLVGHDWGGPTAFSLAAQHRDAVEKLCILDVAIPGDGNPDISQGGKRWHHHFHGTPDLPEALVAGRERLYISWFFANYGHRPDAIAEDDINEYARTYSQPGAMRAGFNYYRAIARDIADNRAMIDNDGKLAMPVLALGGAESWGRRLETMQSLERVAHQVEGGQIENSGHWIPEEQPVEVTRQLLQFLAQ